MSAKCANLAIRVPYGIAAQMAAAYLLMTPAA